LIWQTIEELYLYRCTICTLTPALSLKGEGANPFPLSGEG